MILKSLILTIALQQGVIPTFWQLNQLGPVRLGKLTYDADIPLDPDEFYYLFDTDLKSGLTYLSRKQKFSSVKLTCTRRGLITDVHMSLTSRWSFKKLTVRGVAFGRDAIAQLYDLEPGDPFDIKKHNHGCAVIRQSLIDQGYCCATVEEDILHEAKTKEVMVTLQVHRGRRFTISRVHMNEITDPDLRKSLQEINFDLEGRRYQAGAIEKYEQSLRSLLAFHGYVQPTLQIDRQIDKKRRSIAVTTTLEPNEQRIFEFFGASHISPIELKLELAHLGISAALLPPALLSEELLCLYRKRGYPHAHITVTETGNRTLFSINEGTHVPVAPEKKPEIKPQLAVAHTLPTVAADKIVVAGVCPVPFRYILREAQNLREIDLFDTIQMYPLLRAVSSNPFEIRVRAGVLGVSRNLVWQEGATYKVGGSIAYRNVAHRGGQFRIDGDVTKFEQRIAVQYRHPWILGLPYRTTLKGYYNRYNQPVLLGKNLPLYIAIQQGLVLSVARKMKNISLGLNTGFEWLETSVQNDAAARAINFLPVLNNVQVPYFYCEPTVVLDFLDDKVNPTKGAFTLASMKGMIPFHPKLTTPFLKLLVEQSFFMSLGSSVVAGIRIRAGHVFNAHFSQIMPPDRFLLGGAWSVRGYEPDHVPPLGRLCDPQTGKIIFVPQGGKTMGNLNFELRFPLWRKISGTIFQDVGVLLSDSVAAIKERVVAGSGFGIRYNTPVGPLRFDLGFKWGKTRPQDSRAVWYLTLGNAF